MDSARRAALDHDSQNSMRNEILGCSNWSIHDNVNLIELSKIDDNIYISSKFWYIH